MNLIHQVEALLLASDEPLTLQKLRELLDETPSSDLRDVLATLEADYKDRGISIVQVAGGWQFQTAAEYSDTVSKLWQTRPSRLSRSMLETLAIIAYRQPTTRGEIEALRGMKVSSSVLGGLQERGWVKVLGRKEVPGRPHLYGTGKAFLTDFGLNSLRDLPDSSQLMDEDEVIESVEAQLAEKGIELPEDTDNDDMEHHEDEENVTSADESDEESYAETEEFTSRV
ncbi:MAG TPA: SMC-Scp complex subunit ScpB [Mariprofundaceae bacterium]|nr:SMC-Scp complex subunit ScpB [Mariprofundaceae bacterium]